MGIAKSCIVFTACILMNLALAHGADAASGTPSVDDFNEQVAQCRRVMRQSCAILQDMVRDGVTPEQQAEARELLGRARDMWAAIRRQYAENPPAEYTPGGAFEMRLDDIANAMDDMERALRNGEARRSFRACGYGCGLFVSLNEGYGLHYALDKLFHLRRDIRTAQTLMNTKGADAVRGCLPDLMSKRNAVLLAPPPFPAEDPRYDEYRMAVQELSGVIDELALAFSRNDTERARVIVKDLLRAVNKPYGIAL